MEPTISSAARASAPAAARPFAWMREVTRYQWLVLMVGWLGWVFDAMDISLHALVQDPAMRELLGPGATQAELAFRNGIVFAVTLVGWAFGGVVFGVVSDYFGRSKSLALTILVYSVFTGLSGLAQSWEALAFYRFITGLGLGGEWAAGAALVSEVWPDRLRAKAGAMLQSAGAFGFIFAGLLNLGLGVHSWRWVYFAGAVPALLVLLVRVFVKEPETWSQTAAARRAARSSGAQTDLARFTLTALFSRAHRRDTIVATLLAFSALVVLWGATLWIPKVQRDLVAAELVASQALAPAALAAALAKAASWSVISMNVGSLFGYLAFAPLADRFGRRGAFLLYLVGGLVIFPVTFLWPGSPERVLALLPLVGFFSLGIASGFPIYLPELFPTHMRGTGVGFCFNAGRLITAGGVLVAGHLVGIFGSTSRAIVAVSTFYLFGIFLLPFARETHRRGAL